MDEIEKMVLSFLTAVMRGEIEARQADRIRAAEFLLRHYGRFDCKSGGVEPEGLGEFLARFGGED